MLQSEITGDGMDAVASEISLVERSRRCAIHIFTQTRFLEVTIQFGEKRILNLPRLCYGGKEYEKKQA